MHTLPRFQWGDRFEFCLARSRHRHNHPRQFCVNRFRGLGVLTSQNLAISIGLAGRSYNSISTAVLHCEW